MFTNDTVRRPFSFYIRRIGFPFIGLFFALMMSGCTPGNVIVVTRIDVRSDYVSAIGAPALNRRIAARATALGGTCGPWLQSTTVLRCGSFGTDASTQATFGVYDDDVYRIRIRTWITKLAPKGSDTLDSGVLLSDAHRALETWLLSQGVPRAQMARAIRQVGERAPLDLFNR